MNRLTDQSDEKQCGGGQGSEAQMGHQAQCDSMGKFLNTPHNSFRDNVVCKPTIKVT